MSKYIPFLSSTFIKQLDAAADYIFKEISEQYDSSVGVEYSEALINEIKGEINLICQNPSSYPPYEFQSSRPTLNDRLNQLNWKSANTNRFHLRLFFFYEKSRVFFVCLYGSGQNTDHLILEDIDYSELGLQNPHKFK